MEICIRPENAPSLRVVEKLGFRYEGLRRRYIHINGDWRDHFCFALVAEEVPEGVLRRWQEGRVPAGQGSVPADALAEAGAPASHSDGGCSSDDSTGTHLAISPGSARAALLPLSP